MANVSHLKLFSCRFVNQRDLKVINVYGQNYLEVKRLIKNLEKSFDGIPHIRILNKEKIFYLELFLKFFITNL